jgi:hypothetical protein
MRSILYKLFLLLCVSKAILIAEPSISSIEIPMRAEIVYKAPTERFNQFYNYDNILNTLRSKGMSLQHRNFFEHIIPHEEFGFFGYHSSTQGFRIFQDIIRIVLEDICKLDIKKDFYFLRVPGGNSLNRQSSEQFLKDYPTVNDSLKDQQEQLLSMNYALFGNFENFGECTVSFFTENKTAWSVVFQSKLISLFDSLGLPTYVITELFELGKPLMTANNGVLFQLFDLSHHNPFHKPYQLVDQMCYTARARSAGTPDPIQKKLSELYFGEGPQAFTAQFRLVINNSHILNPYSPLTFKRYERTDPQIVNEYETKLREAIRKLPYDQTKAKQYRQLLLTLWGEIDEL